MNMRMKIPICLVLAVTAGGCAGPSVQTEFDPDGLSIGPGSGSQLEYVTSFVTEWYGWAAYHPQTNIFGR